MRNHTHKNEHPFIEWFQNLWLYRQFARLADSLLSVRKVGLLLLMVAILNGVIGYVISHPGQDFSFETLSIDFYANASTELVSLALTVLVIDWLNQRSLTKHQKKELILKMGSPEHAFAVEAARELRQNGWLTDGSLRGMNFEGANLRGADLSAANLQGVILRRAILRDANLGKANLRGADLFGAKLEKAILEEADLQGARLEEADLREADMRGADLVGTNLRVANLYNAVLREADLHNADLYEANLEDANLREADLHKAELFEANLQNANLRQANLQDADLVETNLEGTNLSDSDLRGAILLKANLQGAVNSRMTRFDANTILPDEGHWSPQHDLARFTDPQHAEFWRSDDKHSPACYHEPDATGMATDHTVSPFQSVTLEALMSKLDTLTADVAAVKARIEAKGKEQPK